MSVRRTAIKVRGAVQGVGFRPFAYRLATDLGLAGHVGNDSRGVFIEVEGASNDIDRFIERLNVELPSVATIRSFEVTEIQPQGTSGFTIARSDAGGARTTIILPDLATCAECRAEILDPADRRHAYPFTNCTNCGPRFSIILDLPYDRPNTTMAGFTMCGPCLAEYEDPRNRRFHAQPNACADCGPHLSFTRDGASHLTGDARSLDAAADAIREGGIVAVKGLGGYQFICDATDDAVVATLRSRKRRPTKPLAVMVVDLDAAADLAELTTSDRSLLTSPQAPIVLVERRTGASLARGVAPGNPWIGLMLPTTPIHHLLLRAVDGPVVATSGNLSDEPICIEDLEAMQRLGAIADAFLVHDRPIARHVDDSVAWSVDGEARVLRRARGYAPMPVTVDGAGASILATGAHLKNTISVSVGTNVFASQHIGDLETPEARVAFERVIDDLMAMYDVHPDIVAHDLHPDYVSTRRARQAASEQGARVVAVQHHHAHLASCLADNDIHGRALGVTWDGTGYGTDGTVWGGEFLVGSATQVDRVGHLLPFSLPGGEAAVREPRRSALALFHAMGTVPSPELPGLGTFTTSDVALLTSMVTSGVNSPVTTSAGRLFDAIAAITGLVEISTFEGEAAMALEHAAQGDDQDVNPYGFAIDRQEGVIVIDWRPAVAEIVADIDRGVAASRVANRFHETLTTMIIAVAIEVREPYVALTGGCFQNRILTERTAAALRDTGFTPLLHRHVPPNDGGISIGQSAVAMATATLEVAPGQT